MEDGQVLLLLLPLLPLLLAWFILGNGGKLVEGIRQKHQYYKLPPGPPGLPLIGNLHQLGQNPHRALWELSKRHGPLMRLRLGTKPCVVVSSAQMAEAAMKTHDLKFCGRPAPTSWKRLTHGFSDVAFSPYGETWRELRKTMVLGFLSARKVERFRTAREEEVERMVGFISSQVSLMEQLSRPAVVINLSKLLGSLANDVTCRAAFGGRRPRESEFYRITKEAQELLVGTFMADYFPCGGAGWVLDVLAGRQARLEKNFAELDGFFREVIKAHTDPERRRPEREEEDITDVLLRLQREDGAHMTEKHVKGVLFDVLLGGTDTSSATLEFAMAELVRNPDAMSKAQAEVRAAVAAKGKVEEGDVPRLSYLRCVVKETLRLHPVVPLLVPRETTAHVKIGGYDVPPGTRVLVNAWAIGREAASWEELPEAFVPERFMGGAATVDFKGHDFQYIPFGAGRRICPGLGFAVALVELALANLLYAFDWEAVGAVVDMAEGTGIATHSQRNEELFKGDQSRFKARFLEIKSNTTAYLRANWDRFGKLGVASIDQLEWCRNMEFHVELRGSISLKQSTVSWEKPQPGWLKGNYDGSCFREGNPIRGGLGFIIRDSGGRCVQAGSKAITNCSPIKAEALAARECVRRLLELKDQGAEGFWIEGDNSLIAEYLNCFSMDKAPPEITNILLETKGLLQQLNRVKISHINRPGNQAADWLAKQAALAGFDMTWRGAIPQELAEICNKDTRACEVQKPP